MGITMGPLRINYTYEISDGAKTALHGRQFSFNFLICNLQIIWQQALNTQNIVSQHH